MVPEQSSFAEGSCVDMSVTLLLEIKGQGKLT
jgi:hypothetical protein